MKTVRSVLEQRRNIPLVELRQTEQYYINPPIDVYDMFALHSLIGSCELMRDTPATLAFADVCLEVDARGKGMGLGAYVSAIELAHSDAYTFTSGSSVSESALTVWNTLIDAGVARVIRPPVVCGQRRDGQLKYDCTFIVPPLES